MNKRSLEIAFRQIPSAVSRLTDWPRTKTSDQPRARAASSPVCEKDQAVIDGLRTKDYLLIMLLDECVGVLA